MIKLLNPSHPGDFLKHEVLDANALSVTDAAVALRVTRQALSSLLNGKASLSPEMALRFEKAFGISMDTLLRMQTSYDISQARRRSDQIEVEPYATPAAA